MSLCVLFLIFTLTLKVKCSNKQPNIILILADDLGWNDVGFHGSSQIPTPNIDALAYNGEILHRFYMLSSESPTRAALMTGVYPIRYGFQGSSIDPGNPAFVPYNIPFLSERLKTLGYIPYMVGHWDLGYSHKKATPLGRGFKKFYGNFNRNINYFSQMATVEDVKTGYVLSGTDLRNGTKTIWSDQGTYATDQYTDNAVKFIKMHDKTKPMFLYISHLAPSVGDGQLEVPDVRSAVKKYQHIYDYHRRIFADAVNRVDQSIGEIMKALSLYGMLDNSIVVFLSDNGAIPVEPYANYGSNWPLRGIKPTLFEGGVRVPAVLYSPQLKQKGVINYNLMHVTDLLPTFYGAAGGNPKTLGKIDGVDQWNSIKDYTKGNRYNALLDIDEINKMSALISENGQYKLINGSIKQSVYDGYLGDKGRHAQNPGYDIKGVLTSPTNIAIQKVEKEMKLDKDKIKDIRNKTTLWCTLPPKPKLCDTFCLFDLEKDPCETTNIIDKVPPNILLEMKLELGKYWLEYVPQHEYIVDLSSNPVFKNGTWFPWLG